MNVNYRFTQNPLHRMYDFYFLSTFALNVDHRSKRQALDMQMMAEEFIEDLTRHLTLGVKFSIAAELRHLHDGHTRNSNHIRDLSSRDYDLFQVHQNICGTELQKDPYTRRIPDDFEIQNIGVSIFEQRQAAFNAALRMQHTMGLSELEFAKWSRHMYDYLTWGSSFGGAKWGQVAGGLVRILQAETLNQKIIACDHIYDLVHNGGPCLDKVQVYLDVSDGFDWLRRALEIKKYIKSPLSYLNVVSPELRRVVYYVGRDEESRLRRDEERNFLQRWNTEI